MKNTSLFRTIVDNVHDGVYFVDVDRRVSMWNHAAEQMTGYTAEEVVGQGCPAFAMHQPPDGVPMHPGGYKEGFVCDEACPLAETLGSGAARSDEVMWLRGRDGTLRRMLHSTLPVYSSGEVAGAVGIFRLAGSAGDAAEDTQDDTALPQQTAGFEEADAETEQKNALGELPGPEVMTWLLRQMLAQEAEFCVILADVDYFEAFNHYYGEQTGDAALQSIAGSLAANLPEGAALGRWHDDAFICLCPLGQPQDAPRLAEQMRNLVAASAVEYGEELLAVTASVGLTRAVAGDTPESMIERAEAFVAQSKAQGKNRSTVDAPPATAVQPPPEQEPEIPATDPLPLIETADEGAQQQEAEYPAPQPLPPAEQPLEQAEEDAAYFFGQRLL